MSLVAFLRHGLRLLVPLAVACTVYLYLYPVFGGCAFPVASRDAAQAFDETRKLHWPHSQPVSSALAPFRLLALGDPQLEGDTSIPTYHHGTLPHAKTIVKHLTFKTKDVSLWERARLTLHEAVDVVFEDIPNLLESARKHVDHFGNDFYLAHIYRTLHWWTRPTHVSVLGDLLGSQWISDAEFERRGSRFWNRAFKGAERLPDDVAKWPEYQYEPSGILTDPKDAEVWSRRLLNVAGNHDIGYAGDLTKERVERFERLFGKVNYELRFELPITDPEVNATIIDDNLNPDSLRLPPEIRIVAVNDMNLDTPAKDSDLQDATYNFLNAVIGTSASVDLKGIFTLVLTHIPLHKPEGICVDSPFFDFHADGGGVKEQNLLSLDASKGFLEGIFGISADTNAAGNGRGRSGLLLNGHDHEGCDTFHYVNHSHGSSPEERKWTALRWADAVAEGLPGRPATPGRREVTVRSMMGGFGGNAGLLSMWFDQEAWEWRYEYVDCPLGTQHFWWLAHILDLSALVGIVLYGLVLGLTAAGVDVDGRFHESVCWAGRRLGVTSQAKAVGSGSNSTTTTINSSIVSNGAADKGMGKS